MQKRFTLSTSLPSQSALPISTTDDCLSSYVANIQLVERRRSFDVWGVLISALSVDDTIRQVASWAKEKTGTKLVSFTNVHMLTEGRRLPGFREIHAQMDLNCPDGMPLVWLGRLRTGEVTRVCGPEFMQAFCENTSHEGFRHFFYGGKEGVADRLIAKLRTHSPLLQIAGHYAPPFRASSPEEDAEVVRRINDSGADIVWVCLGCPKQEMWIHEHRDKLRASVLLAVGLAFDIVAGDRRRAPAFLRNAGLEWLYRLVQEPARLGTRYLKSNSLFLYMLFLSSFSRR
jgi:N-acetylglucosaminyldiphosphoundecaprenol N-acetyl-beta-D-mannosaminyltransferase